MKKFESDNSFDENLVTKSQILTTVISNNNNNNNNNQLIPDIKLLSKSSDIKSSKITKNSKIKLRKSFSDDINPSLFDNDIRLESDEIKLQQQKLLINNSHNSNSNKSTTGIEKIKSKSRFSAAFRSLRCKTSNKKSTSLATISTQLNDNTYSVLSSDYQINNNNKRAGIKSTDIVFDSPSLSPSSSPLKNLIQSSTPSLLETDINNKSKFELISILKNSKNSNNTNNNKLNISRKFSLGKIKKKQQFNKKINKNQFVDIPTFVSSSTQTPNYNFDQQTSEDSLRNSQQNLREIITVTNTNTNNKNKIFEEVQRDSNQIPIFGIKSPSKRIIQKEKKKYFSKKPTSSITTENEDYLSALSESSALADNNNIYKLRSNNKKQEITTDSNDLNELHDEHGKLNVTESTRDTPPQERAPARPKIISPSLSDQSIDDKDISNTIKTITITTATEATTTTNTGSPTKSDTVTGKGAIRKATTGSYHTKLKRQQSRDEYFDSDRLMRREGDLDRGRRFPRPPPIDQSSLPESQQQKQQKSSDSNNIKHNNNITVIDRQVDNIQSGNSITNPNLSGSIAADLKNQSCDEESEEQHPLTARKTKIQFSIGKAVRSRTSSSPSSYTALNQINKSSDDTKDYSSIESNKSSDSQSPISEGSVARRKIKYINQATFYTDEEREILAGKREAYSNLSGISEYSLDSEFSIDTQMPAFGDLTMEHEEAPIMTTLSSEKREHLYKILVIGELGTGKTSFIKRYVHQFFSQNYRATIGVDFALKVLNWDKNTTVRLQLWDIAGQERFGNMTRVYYKEAVGAFIVFDVTRSSTFDCVSKWKEDLDSKVQLPDGSPIPCILLANKCDQEKQCAITPEKMEDYCRENGFAGWFETSAKDNINIEEAARALVNKILLNDKLISASDIIDNDKFALGGGSGTSTSQSSKTCSC